jgi:hypothetical protein
MVKVHEYKSYEQYVSIQTRENKKKVSWVYAREEGIKGIVTDKGTANSVLCHGTRNGKEMSFFAKYWPDAEYVGTEISDNAHEFKNTVQWDMQEPKDEWIGKWDVVYSNAYDHCIKPEYTLQTWKDQLAEGGTMYLEYAEAQSIGNENDPLDATLREVIDLVKDAGFKNVDCLDTVVAHNGKIIRGDK